MNDGELVQAAANAAGILYEWHYGCGDAVCLIKKSDQIYWNPLRSDTDAFRLANKLKLTVIQGDSNVIVKLKQYSGEWVGELIEDELDRDFFTRRAITRAAAEIHFKSLKKGEER